MRLHGKSPLSFGLGGIAAKVRGRAGRDRASNAEAGSSDGLAASDSASRLERAEGTKTSREASGENGARRAATARHEFARPTRRDTGPPAQVRRQVRSRSPMAIDSPTGGPAASAPYARPREHDADARRNG
jgi:hypothetical protein